MPKQDGIISLKGSIDNVTFYKSAADGYLARKRGGINASRIATDPAFQRTRENGAEFGRAGAGGKLLRTALRGIMPDKTDTRMVSRLTREMMKVLQADSTNDRGLRNISDGDLLILSGFEFNLGGKLTTTMYAPFTPTIDKATGNCKIDIPAFIPANMISAPKGATHFELLGGGLSIDFTLQQYQVSTDTTNVLPLDNNATAAISLSVPVTAGTTGPVLLCFGVAFYQEVNGKQYPLNNGAFNSLAIVLIGV